MSLLEKRFRIDDFNFIAPPAWANRLDLFWPNGKKDTTNQMSDSQIYLKLEEQWVNDAVAWIEFLRVDGRELLDLPIPAPYLASKSHFFDLIENGGLHLQRFPRDAANFNIDDLSMKQVLVLYGIICRVFKNDNYFHQMYLVRECRQRIGTAGSERANGERQNQ